jgi:glycosyltransferase involved in cell wall biosynthesis
MEDSNLQAAYSSARALILPSEIEGFGLPALEAYYLGTPVCFVKGTSVEEILAGVTGKGAFSLESRESFFAALEEVMAMDPSEIRRCGLKLRETFDSAKVAERIEAVFQEVTCHFNTSVSLAGFQEQK